MTHKERIDAVLAGRQPDRPPFSFWHHFAPDQISGPAALLAHMGLLQTWDPDFLKVMNDNAYTHHGPIQTAEDLASLRPLRGDEEGFGRHLDLLTDLRRELGGQVYMTTTIFKAWMVLRLLVQPPTVHLPHNLDAAADAPSRWIRQAWVAHPDLTMTAIRTIGSNLARFAARCLQAGADGIFLSVRDDWVDLSEAGAYERLVRLTDFEIVAAASRAPLNFLHVCGKPADFPAFAKYPVRVLSWADRAAGPPFGEVAGWLKPAICGGVNNLHTLPNGTPDDVEREVRDALRQAGARPIIIAPGCTFDHARVPRDNLEAIRKAVARAH